MNKEDSLLLLLARGTLTREAESQALELLNQEISWPRLLKQARTEEVFPLVYHNLRALDFAQVPEAARTELAGLHRKNAVRNAVLGRELAIERQRRGLPQITTDLLLTTPDHLLDRVSGTDRVFIWCHMRSIRWRGTSRRKRDGAWSLTLPSFPVRVRA